MVDFSYDGPARRYAIRLVAHFKDGRIEVLRNAHNIEAELPFNGTPVLRFSLANEEEASQPQWRRLLGEADVALEVRWESMSPTADWYEPPNGRFVLVEEDADGAAGRQVLYEGIGVYHDLTGILNHADDVYRNSETDEHEYKNMTPGMVMRLFCRGARDVLSVGQKLTWGFSDTQDSNGVAWKAEDRQEFLNFPPGSSAADVLEALEAKVDWRFVGDTLQLSRKGGFGVDRTGDQGSGPVHDVAFAFGREFADLRQKRSSLGAADWVYGVGESHWTVQPVPVDARREGTRGARMASVRLSDAKTYNDVVSGAQDWAKEQTLPGEEFSRDLMLQTSRYLPYLNFRVGDLVSVQSAAAEWVPQMVTGLLFRTDEQGALVVNVHLGSGVATGSVRLAKHVKKTTGGSPVSGSSGKLPQPVKFPAGPPAPPTGVVGVASGSVDAAGATTCEAVVTWVPPTLTENGLGLLAWEVFGYRVDGRLVRVSMEPTHEWVRWGEPDTLQVTQGGLLPDRDYEIRVGARSKAGWGRWSAPVTFRTPKDTTPPPVPSAPVGESSSGMVTWTWDGLTASGAAQPSDFSHATLAWTGVRDGQPVSGVLRMEAGLTLTTGPFDRGTTASATLSSVDVAGNESAPGAAGTVASVASVLDDTGLDEALRLARDAVDGLSGELDSLESDLSGQIVVAQAAADQAAQDAIDKAAAAEAAAKDYADAEAAAAQAAAIAAASGDATSKANAAQAAAEAAAALDAKDKADAAQAAAEVKAQAAQDAADAAQAAASAADAKAVTAQSRADAAHTLAGTAQSAASAAQGAASDAQGVAAAAQARADSAHANAATAQSEADAASAAAASAAGIANNKAVVLYQNAAPAAQYRNANTLWIDTTGGNNTPKRWTSGTTWVAVTDKTAADAASAAAAAQSKANKAESDAASAAAAATAAHNRADQAHNLAGNAQSAANTAQSLAEAAQTLAGTAKSAADNAQVDATAARSEAATAQSRADSAYSGASTAQGAADAAAQAAADAAGIGQAAQSSIDNLQIGGRNLLKDSTALEITSSDRSAEVSLTPGRIEIVGSSYSNAYGWGQTFITDPDVLAGTHERKYTLSVDVKADLSDPDAYMGFRFDFRSPVIRSTDAAFGDTGGEWVRISRTIHVPEGETRTQSLFNFASASGLVPGDVIEYRNWKLERGTKATDWTPAPEDVDASISKVAADAEWNLDNLEIGGRNLFPRSDHRISWSTPTGVTSGLSPKGGRTYTATGNATSNFVTPPSVPLSVLPVGAEYTVSHWVENEGANDISLRSAVWNDVAYRYGDEVTISPGEIARIVGKGVVASNAAWTQPRVHPGTGGLPAGSAVRFFGSKLERGSKATDWTPAPEDVDASIEAKADVLIQSTAPVAAMRKATTLWIDTTGGNNTPKRWTTGTTWVEVTDKAATDAAAAAVAAQNTANQAVADAVVAKDAADVAQAAALGAQSRADAAHGLATTADGRITVATANPTASNATGKPIGAIWEVRSGGVALRRYVLTGATTWTQVKAGQDFIGSNAIGSAQIIDLAVGTAQIADTAITNAKIGNLSVDTAKIANGAITNAKVDNLSAEKINAGTLNANRIGSRSITAIKIGAGEITANEIKAGTITALEIGAGAVTTEKMAAGSIDADRINAGSFRGVEIRGATLISDLPGDPNNNVTISNQTITINRADDAGEANPTMVLGGPVADKIELIPKATVANPNPLPSVFIDGETGVGDFGEVSADVLRVGGDTLDDILDPRPMGIIGHHWASGAAIPAWGNTTYGLWSASWTLVPGRRYIVKALLHVEGTENDHQYFALRHTTGTSLPTINTGSTAEAWRRLPTGSTETIYFEFPISQSYANPLRYNVLLTARNISANRSTKLTNGRVSEFWIEDAGRLTGDVQMALHPGGGSPFSGAAPSPTPQPRQYTKTYNADQLKSWRGTGTVTTELGHGRHGGLQRYSQVLFPAAVRSDLSGVSAQNIHKVEVYLKNEHTWSGSGMTARIHPTGNTGLAANAVTTTGQAFSWARGAGKWVTITGWTASSQSIFLGGGAGTGTAGYGKFSYNLSNCRLRVTYTK